MKIERKFIMQQLFDEKDPKIIQSVMSDEAYSQIFRIFSQHAIEETGALLD